MASRWSTFCDEVLDDLTTNVSGLRGVLPHRLAPYDPEQLAAEAGERHLAVYPAAEAVEEASPLVTAPGGDLLVDLYRIVYWEDAGDESSRGVADEEAAEALFDLLEAVVGRLYTSAYYPPNALGGAEHIRYLGASLPDRSGAVRWFQVNVTVRRSIVGT